MVYFTVLGLSLLGLSAALFRKAARATEEARLSG